MLWHSLDSGNLGMGALTIGNTRLIAAALEKHNRTPVVHIIGGRGELDYSAEVPFESDFVNVSFKGLAKPGSLLRRRIRECDLYFDIGGGDSFSDLYNLKRFALITGSKMIAQKTRRPFVFSPQTIGPFYTRTAKIGARHVLRHADSVFARDSVSYDLLVKDGFESKSHLTSDVAFALPYTAAPDKNARDLANGPVKVGINVSGLIYRRDLSVGDKIKLTIDYRRLTHRMLDRLTGDPRFEVHLVPHVLSILPHEDDFDVSMTLKKQYPQLILPARFAGPSAAKTYIANLDLLIGARMHATIAGVSSGTATLPLGYSRKFSGLFNTIGYPILGDMTVMDEEAIMTELERLLADLPGATKAAVASAARADASLDSYRAYLETLFDNFFASHA